MKRNKNCHHSEEPVVLYFYEELDEAARAEVEARLQVCPSCRAVLEELQMMQQTLPAAPSVEPAAATLFALRRSVAQRVRTLAQPRSPRRWAWLPEAGWWQPLPLAMRVAVAVVLVAVGFWWGQRPDTAPSDFDLATLQSDDPVQQLILAEQSIEASNGSINPFFAGVQEVAFDPQTGLVEIRYNTLNDISVRGRPGDAAVQQLLQQALLDRENPGARLGAIKVLDAVGASQAAPDAELVETLTFLLDEETNEGIRLQALQALRTLHQQTPYGTQAKHVLLGILLNDQNSALRIEALQALTESSLAEQELTNYLQAVREDPNSFIRYQATALLRQMKDVQPLEQLPSSSGGNR